MSEEEIIKNLEEFLKGPCEICKYCDGAIRNHRKAIQGLLDLYQKEKQKNKELENADLTTVYMNGFYDGEKKWKNKIKEKTRYYQELYKQDNSPNEFLISQDCLSKLSFAQELLEERN